MAATPIPTHLVHTVFQYIFPPSLPLPRHLLSRPLIERHNFLGISPTDSVSYLSWPSTHTAQVAAALDFGPPECLTSQQVHDVRYSVPDQETLLAHVHPHSTSPLQIVFVWDVETESWRYHDIRMLPFPDGSLSSLDAALAQRPKNAILQFSPDEFDEIPGESGSTSLASDKYWAGYDSSGSSPTSALVNVITEEDEKAEAAYWASYGDIHGSGDSTVPSPLLNKDHFPPSHRQDDLRGPDIPTDPLITHLHLRLHEHDGLLSPRLLSSHSEHLDPEPSLKIEVSKIEESPAVVSKPEEHANGESNFPHPDTISEIVAHVAGPIDLGKSRREADEGAKDAVRGIYRMWKAQAPSADAGGFMEIVKSALETS